MLILSWHFLAQGWLAARTCNSQFEGFVPRKNVHGLNCVGLRCNHSHSTLCWTWPRLLGFAQGLPFSFVFFLKHILFCVSFSMPSKRTRLWIAILCLLVWKNCLLVLGLLIRAIEYLHLGHTYVFVTLWALWCSLWAGDISMAGNLCPKHVLCCKWSNQQVQRSKFSTEPICPTRGPPVRTELCHAWSSGFADQIPGTFRCCDLGHSHQTLHFGSPGICTCDSGCYNWFGVRNVRAANLHATPSSFNGPVGLDPASCSCNRDTDDEQSKDEATCAASLRAVWCICVRAS